MIYENMIAQVYIIVQPRSAVRLSRVEDSPPLYKYDMYRG